MIGLWYFKAQRFSGDKKTGILNVHTSCILIDLMHLVLTYFINYM